ncbi:MAG: DHH family phosphoesterase [Clostridia bacterium]|nr:DHH family phosphoesterase [Clostridia bacterium]
MKNRKHLHVENSATLPFRLCALFGVFLLALYTVLCTIDGVAYDIVGIIFLVLYLAAVVLAFFNRAHTKSRNSFKKQESISMSTAMAQTIQSIGIPFVVTDDDSKIIWYNEGFSHMVKRQSTLFGINLSEFCQISPRELVKSTKLAVDFHTETQSDAETESGSVTQVGDRTYLARSYELRVAGKSYFMTVFSDTTDYHVLSDLYRKEQPVVAYVVLDNLDELAQYVRVSSREAANQAENVLKKWAEEMHALVREYDRDKYIFVFSREALDGCIEDKFSILEQIRDIRLGDSSMPITVSIGVSSLGETMAEREQNARTALDMALQRGGDQVALRNENGLEYFGGRTKNIQKKTKVLARVIAGQLLNLIASAGNVIIMGHRNPDFDSIGASVGLARLCLHCGVTPRIVVDKNNGNFKDCSAALLETDLYQDIFIDAEAGMDLIRSDSLLIITDANNFAILEEPTIAQSIPNIAIVDHHRKTAEFKHTPLISYIDPSASSASELVAEILEECLPVGTLMKEEATVLLSGVMVDTKNFTRSTGTRTFSAALYLRGEGGNAEIASSFFNEDIEDFNAEAKFGTSLTIYRDNIAITTSMSTENTEGDRLAASKAADKLLTVKNVTASFALVVIENAIHISARSDGSINVQLILERIGGGGHFNLAGARVPGKNMKETLIRLKAAIDEYLDAKS